MIENADKQNVWTLQLVDPEYIRDTWEAHLGLYNNGDLTLQFFLKLRHY